MSQVERYTRDPMSQFLFTYKFWVLFSEIPDDGRNVIHSLVIGYKDHSSIYRNMMLILYSKFRS